MKYLSAKKNSGSDRLPGEFHQTSKEWTPILLKWFPKMEEKETLLYSWSKHYPNTKDRRRDKKRKLCAGQYPSGILMQKSQQTEFSSSAYWHILCAMIKWDSFWNAMMIQHTNLNQYTMHHSHRMKGKAFDKICALSW